MRISYASGGSRAIITSTSNTKKEDRLSVAQYIGSYYQKARKPEDFVKLLEKVNSTIEGHSSLYHLAGTILSNDLGQHDSASAQLKKAIILDPFNIVIPNELGLAYYKAGKIRAALGSFEQALRIDRDYPAANYNKACVLAILGREDEALLYLRKALSLDPKLFMHAKKDRDFRNMRSHPEFIRLLSRTPDIRAQGYLTQLPEHK